MLLRYFPRALAKYVHPVFRPIVLRRRKRFKVKRRSGQKILNKICRYGPMPRIFPFYCETCTLSSRFLHVIVHHLCSKRNESKHVLTFENELRIISIGSISKSKDAQAVMERIPNPQRIDFNIPIVESTGVAAKKTMEVPSLSYLCSQIATIPRVEDLIPTKEEFEEPTVTKPSKTSSLAYICNVCKELYHTYRDYDDHLRESKCNEIDFPEPIELAKNFDLVPEYAYGRRKAKRIVEKKRRIRICSACHRDDFRTTAAFHDHIMDCAKRVYEPKAGFVGTDLS